MRLQLIDPGLDALATNIMQFWRFRLVVWAVVGLFIGLNYSAPVGLVLLIGAAIAETWTWLAARPYLAGKDGTPARRWFTLAAMIYFIVVATTAIVLFWDVGTEPLRMVAVAAVCCVLMHVQLFMSRSTATLLIASAILTGSLIVLVAFFSGYHGLGLATMVVCPIVAFAYVIAGGIANKRTTDALEAAKTEAIMANQAKSAFLAMMSHELRTPMNGVLGMAHALRLSKLDRDQREQVDLLLQSGEGLMTILGDILDVSKIEAGRLEFEAVTIDLASLCELTLNLWSSAASARNVTLVCEIEPSTPRWVVGDPTRLRQIMTNLVSNALKFTEHGSVKLSVRPLMDEAPHGQVRIELSVADTGIGLSPAQIARLFQPFVQAEVSTTRQYGGTGLGLNICKRLAAMMGGDITVESAPGEGSTFRVTLTMPLASSPPVAADEAPEGRGVTGLRILVVEDNAVNRVVASTILGAMGALVDTANDGVEALDRLRDADFDLVLMDIHMPRMDGAEALAHIRAGKAGPSDIPVIALTADAMSGEDQRLMGLGFDAVQPKPIQPAGLVAAIIAASHRASSAAASAASMSGPPSGPPRRTRLPRAGWSAAR